MNKLKNKLALFIVTFAVFAFVLFLFFNHLYIEKKNSISSLENRLYSIENSILESFNDINTLLLKSMNDTSLVFTEQNIQLLKLRKNIPWLNEEFSYLNKELKQFPKNSTSNINKIVEYYQSYIAYLNEITELLKTRSQTNTGIISKLNRIEKRLEESEYCNQEMLNKLTFFSRSYMVYKKLEYVENINWIARNIESEVKRQDIPNTEKIKISSMLSHYTTLFKDLQSIDEKLDYKSPISYTNQLINQKDKISAQFEITFFIIENYRQNIAKSNIIFYSMLLIALIFTALLLNTFITGLINKPVKWLTNNIVKIIYDKQDQKSVKHFKPFTEIEELYKKILVLLQYLKDQEDKRQKAQLELKQSEQRYREMADMLPQSIYETDGLGNLIYVNRAWFKTFGFDATDVENGINIIETIVSETGEAVLGSRKFIHSDFIGVRKDGTTFPALVYSNQVVKNSKMTGVRGIVIDNTERKKYIELLQAQKETAEKLDKQKTSYLADMSHELRTPMNAIIGFADLLASLEFDDKQKEEFVAHINASSKHILHLIDDIIDLARIEAGELNIKKVEVDVNSVLHELFVLYEDILKRTGKSNNIELVLNIPNNTIIASTDPHRLKQVINNLLGNALKFTNSGTIEFGYHITENNLVRFYVQDTGIGISEKDIQNIFDRFRQAGNTVKTKGKGLGLSISQKVIELLGGKIWVESEVNKKTIFYFTLPFHGLKNVIVKDDKECRDESYNWKDKLILIAEDEELNYKVIKEFIRKTQAKVIRAYDGEEVVELCKTSPKIDLVLMDIKMPRKSGYEATREIKLYNRNLPVVAVTAYALTDEKERCFKAGCNEYIAKPFKKEEFLKKLNPFLCQEVDISRS